MIPLYLGIYRYHHNFITKQTHIRTLSKDPLSNDQPYFLIKSNFIISLFVGTTSTFILNLVIQKLAAEKYRNTANDTY